MFEAFQWLCRLIVGGAAMTVRRLPKAERFCHEESGSSKACKLPFAVWMQAGRVKGAVDAEAQQVL